jgi:homoserine dehydrogenase
MYFILPTWGIAELQATSKKKPTVSTEMYNEKLARLSFWFSAIGTAGIITGLLIEGYVTATSGFTINENADPSVPQDIVMELMGGIEPAKTYILKAIQNRKHIVTANKALLALHGDEIFREAHRFGVDVNFEASVGGGIPLIRSIKEGLVANRIHSIFGILNGTSNYILSKMTNEGRNFKEVLKEAQDRGYAETDPRYDVEGIDSGTPARVTIYERDLNGSDDVVEVITPGTLTNPSLLEARRNNFLLAVSPAGDRFGIAFADVSTGEFSVAEIPAESLLEEIQKVDPAEFVEAYHVCHSHLLPSSI